MSAIFYIAFSIVSLIEKRKTNKIAIYTYVVLNFLHFLFFSDLRGDTYYLTASFFDFTIFICLSAIRGQTAWILQLTSIVSLFVNLFGFIIWFLYWPPTAYNWAMLALYGVALYLITPGALHERQRAGGASRRYNTVDGLQGHRNSH